MGVSIQASAKGGKKPVDAELNLIPFIDLLVVNICFLLITAVWVQLARIKVNQKGPGAATSQQERPPVMPIKLVVLVGEEGYVVTAGGERLVVPKRQGRYDREGLARQLKELKTRLPDKEDLTVASEDGIHYKQLIRVMDVALMSHFSQIQVSDAAAAL